MRAGLAVLALLAAGCGQTTYSAPPAVSEPVELSPLPSAAVPKPEIQVLEAPAGTPMPAIRVDPPEPTTTIDYDALVDAEYANYACGSYAGEALEAGWPREQIPKVLRTMWRESNCKPWIRSTTSDSGLMQINDIVLRDHRFRTWFPGFDPQTLFDPLTNLIVARWLWGVDGWAPWSGGA